MDLRINIGANIDGLKRGMAQARSSVATMGRSLGSAVKAGAAIATGAILAIGVAVVRQVSKIIDLGDKLGKTSKQIGITATELQKLEFAARRSGASTSAISAAFRRMSSTIFDADRGIKESTDALARLGLTVDDLRGKGPERQFALIAKELARVESATDKAALAQDIFGRSGTQLIPMLADYGKLADELENIGGVINEDTIAASEALKDSWENMTTSMFAAIANSGIVDELQKIISEVTSLQTELAKAEKLQKEFGQKKPPPWWQEYLLTLGKLTGAGVIAESAGIELEIPHSTYIGPTTPEQQEQFAKQREAKRIELEEAEKNEVIRRERAERQRRADKLNKVQEEAIKQIEKPGDRQARDLAVQKALVGASATAAKEGRVLTDEERMQVEQKAGRDFDQARFERIIDVAMARLSATLPEAFSQEGAQEPAQLRKGLEDAIAKQTAKRQQAEDIEKAKLDISITEEAVRERQQLQTEGEQLKEQKAQQAEELKELQSGMADQTIGQTKIVASSLAQIGGASGVRISDAMVTRPLEVQKQIKNLLDQIKMTSDQIQQNTRNIKATEAPRWP